MKLHSRITSMALALMVALSCAVAPAFAAEPDPFTYDLDGSTGQLMIMIFDADGTLISTNLGRDARDAVIPGGGVMLVGDMNTGGRISLSAGQAGTLSITASTSAMIDMGYDLGGNQTFTSYASSPKTTTSATIRVPSNGMYYFIGRNAGVSSITLTSVTLR